MIILLAFLMACAVLAIPVRSDIKKHGRDNIIVRSGVDLLRFSGFSVGYSFLREWFKSLLVKILVKIFWLVVFIALVVFVWKIIRWL